MNTFAVGQGVRLSAIFRNSSAALTDPTTVTLKYKNPRGDITTKTLAGGQVIRDSLGTFHYDVSPVDVAGRWFYRFEGTGALVAADEQAFTVEDTAF